MAKHYFNNFPNITYGGKKSKNIIVRPTVKPAQILNYNYHMPLTLKEYERPDTVASDLYEDSTYDWILRLVNNQIDPYYDWYLTNEQHTSDMVKKYGSYQQAVTTIMHYRHKVHSSIIINEFTYDKMVADSDPDVANFEPVYAFDYYENINEDNKIISTIASSNIEELQTQIEKKLNE